MGNTSRDTFVLTNIIYQELTGEVVDKPTHYTGVRLQQGVPLIDADWNELEDIEKYERRAFIKWVVGNGVPKGSDGFRITNATVTDFTIKGGVCYVDGWDAINPGDIQYAKQDLYNKNDLAGKWGVDLLPPLQMAVGKQYLVYLDVWEREVNTEEDGRIVNNAIGIETCTRLKREWVVRVVEGVQLPTRKSGHACYILSTLNVHPGIASPIPVISVIDRRRTGLAVLSREITISDDGHVGIATELAVGPFAAFTSQDAQGNISLQGNLSVSGPNAGLDIVRRSLTAWPATPATGDRFIWYNPDGTARLYTDGKGDLLTVTGAGNVIVGTPGPEDKYLFEVAGRMKVRGDRATGTAGVWFSQLYGFGERAFVGLSDDNHIGFWGNTGANWGLVMDTTSGKVGIGTTSPLTSLHIRKDASGALGPSITLMNGVGSAGAGASIDFDGYDPGANAPTARIQSSDNGNFSSHLLFLTKDSGASAKPLLERMRITDQGNVGIGTVNPSAKMEIAGGLLRVSQSNDRVEIDPWVGSNGSAIIFVENGTPKSNLYWHKISQVFHINSAGVSDTTLNLNGGKVGIGMAPSGSYILTIKGNAFATGGQWTNSDRRYKKNIRAIENALAGILSIRGISYEWRREEYKNKGFSDGRYLGVVAQEIEEVFPEIVAEGPDGEKAISYSAITPILIEAIKEQNAIVEKMRETLEALRKEGKKRKL
jgi:hypothetical protein